MPSQKTYMMVQWKNLVVQLLFRRSRVVSTISLPMSGLILFFNKTYSIVARHITTYNHVSQFSWQLAVPMWQVKSKEETLYGTSRKYSYKREGTPFSCSIWLTGMWIWWLKFCQSFWTIWYDCIWWTIKMMGPSSADGRTVRWKGLRSLSDFCSFQSSSGLPAYLELFLDEKRIQVYLL